MRASKPLFLKYTDAMLERSTRGSKIVNIHLKRLSHLEEVFKLLKTD